LEIEKGDGSDFSLEEIQLLKVSMPDQVKGSVEQLTHPIFMPRNEEEVLRNIMELSRQLRFVGDMPHIIITFDEQKGDELCFSIILVRVVNEHELSVQDLFSVRKTALKYIPDRVRKVGNLRRRYVKEATVFRTVILTREFLRADRSVDLYKAREFVLSEVSKVVGALRDYNGGMIYKLGESLKNLKMALGRAVDPILVEKFFYSIIPIEMRSGLETEPLKQFFSTLLVSMRTDQAQLKRDAKRIYFVAPKKKIHLELALPVHKLVSFAIDIHDASYVGYMCLSDLQGEQEQFLTAIDSFL
jgi:hypothetical protein